MANGKPMLIAIIKQDAAHPILDPENPPYLTSWLAFRRRTDEVFIEVEADDPAGLAEFREHYPGAKIQATHELPDDPREWMALQGEALAEEDEDDPQKHMRRAGRLREHLRQEHARNAERNERREQAARESEQERERAEIAAAQERNREEAALLEARRGQIEERAPDEPAPPPAQSGVAETQAPPPPPAASPAPPVSVGTKQEAKEERGNKAN